MADESGPVPLFKLLWPHGAITELYEDGRVTGLPDGVTIINHVKPLLAFLRHQVNQLKKPDT